MVALASVLIILSGESKNSFTYKLLSRLIFIAIGKLSYSLYLWHWPILAFYRYYFTDFGVKGTLICAIATILFSLLSWRFIETPLRYLPVRNRWVYVFYLIIPILLSVTVASLIAKNEDYGNRLSQNALQQYEIVLSTYQPELQYAPLIDKPFKPYLLGATPELQSINKTKATLWGIRMLNIFKVLSMDSANIINSLLQCLTCRAAHHC